MALEKIREIIPGQEFDTFTNGKRTDDLDAFNAYLADLPEKDLVALRLQTHPVKEVAVAAAPAAPALPAEQDKLQGLEQAYKNFIAELQAAEDVASKKNQREFVNLIEELYVRVKELHGSAKESYKDLVPVLPEDSEDQSLDSYLSEMLESDLFGLIVKKDENNSKNWWFEMPSLPLQQRELLLKDLRALRAFFITGSQAQQLADTRYLQAVSTQLMRTMWRETIRLKTVLFEKLNALYGGKLSLSDPDKGDEPHVVDPKLLELGKEYKLNYDEPTPDVDTDADGKFISMAFNETKETLDGARTRLEALNKLNKELLEQQTEIDNLRAEIVQVGSTFLPQEERTVNCLKLDENGQYQTVGARLSRTSAQWDLVDLGFIKLVDGDDLSVYPQDRTPEACIEELKGALTKVQNEKVLHDFEQMEQAYFSTGDGQSLAPYRVDISRNLRKALGLLVPNDDGSALVDNPECTDAQVVERGRELLNSLFPALTAAHKALNEYSNNAFHGIPEAQKTPENRGVDVGVSLLSEEYVTAKDTLAQFGLVENHPRPERDRATVRTRDIFNLGMSASVVFHPENLDANATGPSVVLPAFDQNFKLLKGRVAAVEACFKAEKDALLRRFDNDEAVLQRFFSYCDPKKEGDSYLLGVFSEAGLLVPGATHAYEVRKPADDKSEINPDITQAIHAKLNDKVKAFERNKQNIIDLLLGRLEALGYFNLIQSDEKLYHALLQQVVASFEPGVSKERKAEIVSRFPYETPVNRNRRALSKIIDYLDLPDDPEKALEAVEECFYRFISNTSRIETFCKATAGFDVRAPFKEIQAIHEKLQKRTAQRHHQQSRAFDDEIKQLQKAKAGLQKIAARYCAFRFDQDQKEGPVLVLSVPEGSTLEAEKQVVNLKLLSLGLPKLPDTTLCKKGNDDDVESTLPPCADITVNTLGAMFIVSSHVIKPEKRAALFEDLIAQRPDSLRTNVIALAMNVTQDQYEKTALPVTEKITKIDPENPSLPLPDVIAALRETRHRMEETKKLGYIARFKLGWNTGIWDLESANKAQLLRNKENLILALRRPLEDPIAKRLAAGQALIGQGLTAWQRLFPRWYNHKDYYTLEQMQVLLPLASAGKALEALLHYHPQTKTWAGKTGKAARLELIKTTIERVFAEKDTKAEQEAMNLFFAEKSALFPDLDVGLKFFTGLIDRTSHDRALNYLYTAVEHGLFKKRPEQFIELLMRTIVKHSPEGYSYHLGTLALFKKQFVAYPEAVLDLLNTPAFAPKGRRQFLAFLLEDHKQAGRFGASVLKTIKEKCQGNPKIDLLQLTTPDVFKVVKAETSKNNNYPAKAKASALQDYLVNWVGQATTTPEILTRLAEKTPEQRSFIIDIVAKLPFNALQAIERDIKIFQNDHRQLSREVQLGLTVFLDAIQLVREGVTRKSEAANAELVEIDGGLQKNTEEFRRANKEKARSLKEAAEQLEQDIEKSVANAAHSEHLGLLRDVTAAQLDLHQTRVDTLHKAKSDDKEVLRRAVEIFHQHINQSLTDDPSEQIKWIKKYATEASAPGRGDLSFELNVAAMTRIIQLDTRHYAQLRAFALTDLALKPTVASELLRVLHRVKSHCVAGFEKNMAALKQELIARSSNDRTDIQHRSWDALQDEMINIVRMDSTRYTELLQWVVSEDRFSKEVREKLKETLQKVTEGLYAENRKQSAALFEYHVFQEVNTDVLRALNSKDGVALQELLERNRKYATSMFGKISVESAMNRLKGVKTNQSTPLEIAETRRRLEMVRDTGLNKENTIYSAARTEWLTECASAAVLYQNGQPIYSKEQLEAFLAADDKLRFVFAQVPANRDKSPDEVLPPLERAAPTIISKLDHQARLVAAYQIQARLIQVKADISLERLGWEYMSWMSAALGKSNASSLDAVFMQANFPALRDEFIGKVRPLHDGEKQVIGNIIGFIHYRQNAIKENNRLIAAFLGKNNYPPVAVATLPDLRASGEYFEVFKNQQSELKAFFADFAKARPPANASKAQRDEFAILEKNLEIIQATEDTLHVTLVEQRIQQLLTAYFKEQPKQNILLLENLYAAIRHYQSYMADRAKPRPRGISSGIIEQAETVCFPVCYIRDLVHTEYFLTAAQRAPAHEADLYSAVENIRAFVRGRVDAKYSAMANSQNPDEMKARTEAKAEEKEKQADRAFNALLNSLQTHLQNLTLEKIASFSDGSDVYVLENQLEQMKDGLTAMNAQYDWVIEDRGTFNKVIHDCLHFLDQIAENQKICAHIEPVLRRAVKDSKKGDQVSNALKDFIAAIAKEAKLSADQERALVAEIKTILEKNPEDQGKNSVLVVAKVYQAIQKSIGGDLSLTSKTLIQLADACQKINLSQNAEEEARIKTLEKYTDTLNTHGETLAELASAIVRITSEINQCFAENKLDEAAGLQRQLVSQSQAIEAQQREYQEWDLTVDLDLDKTISSLIKTQKTTYDRCAKQIETLAGRISVAMVTKNALVAVSTQITDLAASVTKQINAGEAHLQNPQTVIQEDAYNALLNEIAACIEKNSQCADGINALNIAEYPELQNLARANMRILQQHHDDLSAMRSKLQLHQMTCDWSARLAEQKGKFEAIKDEQENGAKGNDGLVIVDESIRAKFTGRANSVLAAQYLIVEEMISANKQGQAVNNDVVAQCAQAINETKTFIKNLAIATTISASKRWYGGGGQTTSKVKKYTEKTKDTPKSLVDESQKWAKEQAGYIMTSRMLLNNVRGIINSAEQFHLSMQNAFGAVMALTAIDEWDDKAQSYITNIGEALKSLGQQHQNLVKATKKMDLATAYGPDVMRSLQGERDDLKSRLNALQLTLNNMQNDLRKKHRQLTDAGATYDAHGNVGSKETRSVAAEADDMRTFTKSGDGQRVVRTSPIFGAVDSEDDQEETYPNNGNVPGVNVDSEEDDNPFSDSRQLTRPG